MDQSKSTITTKNQEDIHNLTKRKDPTERNTTKSKLKKWASTENIGDEKNSTLRIGRASDVSLETCKLFNVSCSASGAQVWWVLKTLRARHFPFFLRNLVKVGRTRSEESVQERDKL